MKARLCQWRRAWLAPSCGLVLWCALVTACADGDGPADPVNELAPEVRAHLNELLDLMQNHSVNRLSLNWTSIRNVVFARAGNAANIPAAYSAIREALALLVDGHSSYRGADGTVLFVSTVSCTAPAAGTPALPADVGYVRVGAFSGGGAPATEFANSIQSAIRTADRADLVGWIVDLRGNTGGNMWPMLAGVGPVLGAGVAGYFITPTGTRTMWEYRDDAAMAEGQVVVRADAPYRLQRAQPRVAVLTDGAVASSGEAITVAFRGRPDTRSFGAATCGMSTANASITLTNGAVLNLSVAVFADRTDTRYGGTIPPDELIDGAAATEARALAWLLGS